MDEKFVARFHAINVPFEGRVSWMYLDVEGLVTTGVGNLIDPIEYARILEWRYKANGKPATRLDIDSEWYRVKNTPDLARKGYLAAEKLTQLCLSEPAIDALMENRLRADELILRKNLSDALYDSYPEDVRLCLHSIAWAVGAGFLQTWPKFRAAIVQHDYAAAAKECEITTKGRRVVIMRNHINAGLLLSSVPAAIIPPETPVILS